MHTTALDPTKIFSKLEKSLDKQLNRCYTNNRKGKVIKMKYRLIDDPLCDVNENIDSYVNCEDCPYFGDCMEEDDYADYD